MTGTGKCGTCGKVISANKEACLACLELQAKKAAAAPEPPTGGIEILNVQGGDIKITFSKDDPVETIRAKRIIQDMLRRGYALVVEVERGGVKAYERVQEFDEKTGEYIIADFDPMAMASHDEIVERELSRPLADLAIDRGQEEDRGGEAAPSADPTLCFCGRAKGHRGAHKGKRLPMEMTKATGIGRSAGG